MNPKLNGIGGERRARRGSAHSHPAERERVPQRLPEAGPLRGLAAS